MRREERFFHTRIRRSMRSGRPGRQRWVLAILILLIVAGGLASRSFPGLTPAKLGKYPGDALWALAVFFAVAFVRPAISPRRLAVVALTISWLVEFSQIYQAPWIDAIRANFMGHLFLGSAFDAWDLCAYAAGVSAGFVLDISLFHGVSQISGNRTSPSVGG